jgi:hypothetical protein
MFQRLKRLWALSNYETRPVVHRWEDAWGKSHEIQGDGKAVFLSDMTEEEHEDYVHQEERGWGKFYKRYFGKDAGQQ